MHTERSLSCILSVCVGVSFGLIEVLWVRLEVEDASVLVWAWFVGPKRLAFGVVVCVFGVFFFGKQRM